MSQSAHQWAKFEKGRLKLTACADCGVMSLPGNIYTSCEQKNILSSPIVKAGYRISAEMPFLKNNKKRHVA